MTLLQRPYKRTGEDYHKDDVDIRNYEHLCFFHGLIVRKIPPSNSFIDITSLSNDLDLHNAYGVI